MVHVIGKLAFAIVVLAAPAAGLSPTSAAPAAATDGTEIIRTMAAQMTAVLGQGQSQAAREERFRALYRAYFDVPSINAWAMGAAWQQATPAQKQELSFTLESYIVKAYTVQLGAYSGQTLQVGGGQPDGEGMVVSSQISGGNSGGINVNWRMRKVGNTFKIRDVMVENVSMSVNLRREFAAIYQQTGSVDSLLTAMRSTMGQPRAR